MTTFTVLEMATVEFWNVPLATLMRSSPPPLPTSGPSTNAVSVALEKNVPLTLS